MKKNDITISKKAQAILEEYNQNLEKEITDSIEKTHETKVYIDLLKVEKAIKNSGIPFSIGNASPSAWQSLVANIICYEQYHDYKNEKTFGQQYMEIALKNYDEVYSYYTFKKEDSKPNPPEIKESLENLLTSIHEEIEKCERKLKNNNI